MRALGRGKRGDGPGVFALGFAHRQGAALGREELLREFIEEGQPVIAHALLLGLDIGVRERAFGVVIGLEQERRHGCRKHRLGHAPRAVLGDIARHFTATHGKAHQRGRVQVQVVEQDVQVLGQRIVVIALPGLGRMAETPAVIADHPETRLYQRPHLWLPGAATQRPAMDQHHGLALAEILIVQLQILAGVLGEIDKGHERSSVGCKDP
ncbi:hypothetical protein D3C71_1528270 [compost metagenome]